MESCYEINDDNRPCQNDGEITARTPDGEVVSVCYEHFQENEELMLNTIEKPVSHEPRGVMP